MTDFNLIKVDGKPLRKLVDVISNGIGKLYEPTEIRKRADAKAYEIVVIEKAKAKALGESKEIEQDYLDRIEERRIHRELKKQENLDKINYIAAEQLKNEQTVSDEPVDDDWTTRFFNIAEDISNEEMQSLWGRILAGEVKKPGSYSLRTLELLKNLSKLDAECFMKFGQLSFTSSGISFILNFKDEKLLEDKYNLTFADRLLLEELDLLTANDLSFNMVAATDKDLQTGFKIGDTIIVAERKKGTPKQTIIVLVFTKIGQELLELLEFSPDLDYVQLLASKIRRDGVTVKYAKFLQMKSTQLRHTGLIEVPLTEEEQKQEEEKRKRH
jgi:uncharacterized repeat protein (TIGR03899 family)